MMKKIIGVAVVLAFACASAAAAQTTGTQTGTAKKQTAGGAAAAHDETFAKEAAVGGLAEVEIGQLATANAASDDVKQFGQMMVTDHGKANDELKSIAQKENITLPTELNAKYKALRDKLSKLKGAEFDRQYMREMVKDHEQDVAKFRKQASGGRNAELKAFAEKTVPVLEKHLAQAKEISAKVGGSSTAKEKKPTGL